MQPLQQLTTDPRIPLALLSIPCNTLVSDATETKQKGETMDGLEITLRTLYRDCQRFDREYPAYCPNTGVYINHLARARNQTVMAQVSAALYQMGIDTETEEV